MKKYINFFLLILISILLIPQTVFAFDEKEPIVIKMRNKKYAAFFSEYERLAFEYLLNNNILVFLDNENLEIVKNQNGKELFRVLFDGNNNEEVRLNEDLTIDDNIEFDEIIVDFVDDSKDDELTYLDENTLVINFKKYYELVNSGERDRIHIPIINDFYFTYLNDYDTPIKHECDSNENMCFESFNDKKLVVIDNENEIATIPDDLTIDDNIEFDLDPNSELGQMFSKVRLIYSTKNAANRVYIRNINLEEKTGGAIINGKASADGLNIDVDVKFNDVNDYVLYKVVVKNNTDIDYLIDNQTKFGDREYIKYDFEFENDDNYFAAKSEKVMFVRISYNKEIPEEILALGTYSEAKKLQVSLKTETSDTYIDNPKTCDSIIKIATILVVSVILLVIMIKVEKVRKVMALVIGILIIIPTITKAQETLNITINAKIEVVGMKKFCYRTYSWNNETGKEIYTDAYYSYKDGMNWNDYSLSEKKADVILPNNLQYFVYEGCGNNDINCEGKQRVTHESIIKDSSIGCYYYTEELN